MRLQMKGPRIGRRRDEVDRARVLGVAHIDDREAVAEHVADIGVALVHHDLHAVAASALVAAGDEIDVAGGNRDHRPLLSEPGFCAKYATSSGRGFQLGLLGHSLVRPDIPSP